MLSIAFVILFQATIQLILYLAVRSCGSPPAPDEVDVKVNRLNLLGIAVTALALPD